MLMKHRKLQRMLEEAQKTIDAKDDAIEEKDALIDELKNEIDELHYQIQTDYRPVSEYERIGMRPSEFV